LGWHHTIRENKTNINI